jgi:hypothetical protein
VVCQFQRRRGSINCLSGTGNAHIPESWNEAAVLLASPQVTGVFIVDLVGRRLDCRRVGWPRPAQAAPATPIPETAACRRNRRLDVETTDSGVRPSLSIALPPPMISRTPDEILRPGHFSGVQLVVCALDLRLAAEEKVSALVVGRLRILDESCLILCRNRGLGAGRLL